MARSMASVAAMSAGPRSAKPRGRRASTLRGLSAGTFVIVVGPGAGGEALEGGGRVVAYPPRGGKQAAAALLSAPMFPMVIAILLQAPKLGRTCTVREVAGAREVVVEIRRPGR